jgi:uncharacterized membrane protein
VLGKHTLDAKEKTSLRIVYDTKGLPGPFRKIVTISTDIPSQKEVKVTMEGTVREAPGAKIAITPRKVLLGTMKPGSLNRREFSIANTGKLPLVIQKIHLKGGATTYFDSSKGEPMVIEPGSTKKLELDIKINNADGQHQELIVIESNAKNAPGSGYVIMVQYGGAN